MEIKLSNTLGKAKQTFKPIKEGEVSIYTCGPTVYHYAHIGNLRSFFVADILKRVFLFNKYKVSHIINITDVGHLSDDGDEGEDKLEKGAKREGKTVWEVAEYYTKSFIEDYDALNIIQPDKFTKATDHIQEMIDMIKKLEEKGFTYISEGNVYFDTGKDAKYGTLVKRGSDEDSQGRVDEDEHKKNKNDFVLWFTRHKYESHAMEWDSPWGKGFPGWHIECSAMSEKYLGDKFDIHTGGADLAHVHHTNEIAQNDCTHGHKTVNYWIHTEFLVEKDKDKMSKSSGDFLRLKSITDTGYTPIEYRYFLLGTHYKKQIMFSWKAMDSAKNTMKKLKNRIEDITKNKEESETVQSKPQEKYLNKFNEEINDDLNTPQALATLWDTVNDTTINRATKLALIEKYDEVLGLKLTEFEKPVEIPQEITDLAEKRWEAKQNKEWDVSDKLREEVESKGYKILDNKEGYEVKPL